MRGWGKAGGELVLGFLYVLGVCLFLYVCFICEKRRRL